ncbi:Kinesin-like protein [Mycena venus]|uniref:Phosphatidate cytidylyltransferase, mitochondrial n=1 Tax=Mycena venus TaxID=2733690 RepID=A0A8H7DAS2_9AGAR|nr:Kinesin-like protein [Mycena venus]
MLSTVARVRHPHAYSFPAVLVRSLTTETIPSTPDLPPPPPPKKPARSRLFGRNQLLPVSNSTRALLESIVEQFDAPIRYAFAYGSGVFEQDGYPIKESAVDGPMLDFMFAVTHPAHFHSINMQQHPSHYTFHARVLGSDYVTKVQEFGPGVWFNAYIPMAGVTIKYGVTTVDNLCSDLLNWRSLYLAGRMHKPLRIIKDDARVRLTQQVNLTSALFERIAGISYLGDPRMMLPAENRGKVANIVRNQSPQFKELYHRLVVGLPGVHWPAHSASIQQDTTPHARAAHLKKLPSNLLTGVRNSYDRSSATPAYEADESAYWIRLAGDDKLPATLGAGKFASLSAKINLTLPAELRRIVRYPATVQSFKGIISAGVGKSARYGAAKIGKWWNGTGSSKESQ